MNVVRHPSMSMMAKTLKILPHADLNRLARGAGITEPERMLRIDCEYALLSIKRQRELARAVGLMVWRALKKEVEP